MAKTKKIMLLILVVGIIMFSAEVVLGLPLASKEDVISDDTIIPTDYEFLSNRYTQEETDARLAVNEFVDLSIYSNTVVKNDIKMYYSKDDLSFVIEKNGYYWSSKIDTSYLADENSPLNEDGDLGASNFLQKRMKSPVIVSYYVNDELKKDEGVFDSGGTIFTTVDLKEGNEKIGFEANITFAVSGIRLKLKVYLDDSGLNVEIPYSSIKDGSKNKLSNISVYPYFGATKRSRVPGYVFIPDGIGALIRFDDTNKGVFTKRFYGNDLSLAQQVTDEQILYANLYGLVHGINQNAMMGIVENGSAYANLIYYSSRSEDDFNKTFVSFEYRVVYTQYLNAKKTNSVKMLQENLNEYDAKLKYHFLSDKSANYVGMANLYYDYLDFDSQTNNNQNIGLHLNVLAAENQQTLFGRKSFSMTTVEELITVLNNLNSEGITNIDVTYHGWMNNGYSNSNVKYKKINGSIGNKKDVISLTEMPENNIYFTVNYQEAKSSVGGYGNEDVIQSINKSLIEREGKYLLSNTYGYHQYQSDYGKFKKIGISNIELQGFVNLTGNYSKDDYYTREEAIGMISKYLEIASKTSVAKPLSFLWYADMIYDIPIYSSNQGKFTDTVPFIPLVLSNRNVYGRTNTFFSNRTNELLRMVDYNLYPSFYITKESSNLLLRTDSNNIYTSRFSDWKSTIISDYDFVNQALKNTINSRINSREVVELGLIKNVYDNGVTIYINYSGIDHVINGKTIKATSYEVVKS
ncbi:MAG: DUF5696 domain-containing protein [Acholeplasma sp.]|nr:DUF5696 domain-containing protein [Acholeplasma sp.]